MTPYLVIGGIGVALLVFSLVVGELFDGLFDAFGSDLLSGAVARRLPRRVRLRRRPGPRRHRLARRGHRRGPGRRPASSAPAPAGCPAPLNRGGDDSNVRVVLARRPRRHRRERRPVDGLRRDQRRRGRPHHQAQRPGREPLPAGTPVTITAVLSATSVQVAPRPADRSDHHHHREGTAVELPDHARVASSDSSSCCCCWSSRSPSATRSPGPNEAFIVTGRRGKEVRDPATGAVSTDLSGQKVVMGGGVFVLPFVQRLHILDLSSRRIPVQIRGAVSGQGVKLNLEGVAIVKVGGNEDSIRAAAQRFLTQQDDIESFTQEVLAGSLRSIVGSLSVEQIIRDRAAFAQQVADEAETSLTGQGLVLDTFQIQDITDDGSYLADLGRPEAARVKQTAAIAEAEARRAAEQARIKAEEEIAIAQRALALKQAEIKAETDAAAAQAAAAGPLAQADRDQAILAEQEKVAVRQAALNERELDTEVRKPADAAALPGRAGGRGPPHRRGLRGRRPRQASIAAAQAEAEKARLTGEGEKSRRSALAEAEAIEGAKRGEAEKARGASPRPRRIGPRVRRRPRRSWRPARPRPRRWRRGPPRSRSTTRPRCCRCWSRCCRRWPARSPRRWPRSTSSP